MRAEPATIELGELPPHQPEVEPRWPIRIRLRRRLWWLVAAVTGLLLVTVSAAAAPRASWLTPHFTASAGGEGAFEFHLGEEILYVADRPGAGGEQTLTAYRLADGSTVWEARAEEAYLWNGVPQLYSSESATLLDPETGQERWRGEDLQAVTGNLALTGVEWRPGSPLQPTPLTAVDWTTGAEVWTLPSVTRWAEDGERLVTLDHEGQLTSYQLATATRLATTRDAAVSDTTNLTIAGDLALVQPEGDSPRLDAYDVATLTHRWSTDSRTHIWDIAACGPVVCVNVDGTPEALDPATGELAWSVDWYPVDFYYIDHPGPPWPPDYLLLSDGLNDVESPDRLPTWVIDAETGGPVLNLGEWRPLWQPATGAPWPILTRYDANRAPVVEQLGPNRQRIVHGGGGRTWFARLHLDPPRIEVLGAVDSGATGCLAGAGYVACEDGAEVQVHRVR